MTLPQYEEQIQRLEEAVAAEKTASKDAIEAQKAATLATEKERDTYKEKALYFENALKAVTKKRSFGCTMAKILTFGISGCH